MRAAHHRLGPGQKPIHGPRGAAHCPSPSQARTLTALAREYTEHPRESRRLVIAAKDHARFLGRTEMAAWMLVWLENPPVFEVWSRVMLEKRSALPNRQANMCRDE